MTTADAATGSTVDDAVEAGARALSESEVDDPVQAALRRRLARKVSHPYADRFWEKVDRSGECWVWQGATSEGRPKFRIGDDVVHAARVAWSLTHGSPLGRRLRRACNEKRCVNPAHLK